MGNNINNFFGTEKEIIINSRPSISPKEESSTEEIDEKTKILQDQEREELISRTEISLSVERRLRNVNVKSVLLFENHEKLVFSSEFRIQVFSSSSFRKLGIIKADSGFPNHTSLIKWDDSSFLWSNGSRYFIPSRIRESVNTVKCYSIEEPFPTIKEFKLPNLFSDVSQHKTLRYRSIHILKLNDDQFCVFCPFWFDFTSRKGGWYDRYSFYRRKGQSSEKEEIIKKLPNRLLIFSFSSGEITHDLTHLVSNQVSWYSKFLKSRTYKNSFFLFCGSSWFSNYVYLIDHSARDGKGRVLKKIRVANRNREKQVSLKSIKSSSDEHKEVLIYAGRNGVLYFYSVELAKCIRKIDSKELVVLDQRSILCLSFCMHNCLCFGDNHGRVFFIPRVSEQETHPLFSNYKFGQLLLNGRQINPYGIFKERNRIRNLVKIGTLKNGDIRMLVVMEAPIHRKTNILVFSVKREEIIFSQDFADLEKRDLHQREEFVKTEFENFSTGSRDLINFGDHFLIPVTLLLL